MSIKKVAICDVCGKQADLVDALEGGNFLGEEKFFICNIAHVICSEKCFDESRVKK